MSEKIREQEESGDGGALLIKSDDIKEFMAGMGVPKYAAFKRQRKG